MRRRKAYEQRMTNRELKGPKDKKEKLNILGQVENILSYAQRERRQTADRQTQNERSLTTDSVELSAGELANTRNTKNTLVERVKGKAIANAC